MGGGIATLSVPERRPPMVVNLFLIKERKERIMAKTICKVLGIVFILVGICGFIMPDLLGTHLSLAHNLVHIISGAVALYFGFAGSLSGARTFCLAFGAVYLMLGFVGFIAGQTQPHTTMNMPNANDSSLMKVIPGQLELGMMDHVVHVLLGLVFLAGWFLSRRDVSRAAD